MIFKLNSWHWIVKPSILISCFHFNLSCLAAESNEDLTSLPIESLLNMDVYSASKFPQKRTDAPSVVTVISAQDIKDYGYRTLADILQSVRGVYLSHDRLYSYLGTRGLNTPGDLNTRVLILLDGYRLNDAVYDQGPIDTEFPVDVDLIERVEYVSGAGSAIYGNNAFLAVVNVITKTGKNYKGKGVEVSGRVASYGTDQERISYGKHFDSGLDMLVSATRQDKQGENNLYFPEFDSPKFHNGLTDVPMSDKAERLFGKFTWQHFTLESGYSKRGKSLPIGTYGSQFNDPRSHNADQHVFLNLTFDNQIAEHLDLYARVYHGRYDYPATYVYDYPPLGVNKEVTEGRWWGSEARLISTHIANHKLLLGGEIQHNYRLSDAWQAIGPPNPDASLGFNQENYRYGIYLQDEMNLRENLIFNAGLRYDYLSYTEGAVNPRLALIFKPWQKLALKWLYATSFRAPNTNELYFSDPITIPALHLNPEHIQTYEAIIEYQYDHSLRLTAVGFHYEINNLIQTQLMQGVDPNDVKFQLVNIGNNKAWGAELEVEKCWNNGIRLRTSYTWAHAYDPSTNESLLNSPSNLFKLNFTTPIFNNRLRTGFETQYTSSRESMNGVEADEYGLLNWTLTSGDNLFNHQLEGLEISGTVYNLLDSDYASVASDQFVQNLIPQNGRNFRLVFSYHF